MSMEQQTMTGSGLYILIAVQLLFSMLILLRIRQYRKKPTGCLPSVLVILSTAGFISVLYYLWQIVCDENNRWTDLGGMLAAGSWQEWVAWAFFGLFVVLFTAAGCSLFGFALTGHHPKFCKEMWRSLIGMMLIPFLTLALLVASTLCISLSGMTLFTWLFSEAAFSDVAMLVLSAALFTFGYMGLLAFLFKFNGSKLDAYILEDIERSYRRIEETNEKGGKQ